MTEEEIRGQFRAHVEERFVKLESNHESFRQALEKNTVLTAQVKQNTDDIVDFFTSAKGTLRALGALGTIAKWLTSVAAAFALIWLAIKGWNK